MSRFLRITLPLLTLLLLGPAPARADGSVDFDADVMPLLHDRPDLREALAEVTFPWLGSGGRISGKVSPGLAGRRVGPYLFRALRKGESVEVRFATYTRFYDERGQFLGETDGDSADFDLEHAVRLEEEVTAVAITPR